MKGLFTSKLALSLMTVVILLISAILVTLVAPPTRSYAAGQIVCIDPGHGGTDTGATMTGTSGTITEAQETLDIAQRLQTLLLSSNYRVVMTRTNNTTLTNSQRATICNNAGAAILVSIHLNGSSDHTVDYTVGLYGKKNKDQALTSTINYAMAGLPSASGTGTIQNNGITNFADGMLLKATMPATIAETVFITSSSEYSLLTNGSGTRQQAIAQKLQAGINNWFATH
jgi:N-acetylmuramoyl-L-alanine amidase